MTLSGERRPITVLFSDIRGFSKMSQEMAPDDVVRTLNEYFTLMVDIVFRFGLYRIPTEWPTSQPDHDAAHGPDPAGNVPSHTRIEEI